ncbi:MAG: YARHG domain-containing protein, partial [Flavobacteriales bacterium]
EANTNAANETGETRPERVQEEKAPSMNYFARGAGRYPFTSERLIDYRDVRNLSTWDLTVMRNEIFARHGYIFRKNEDVIRYFNNQPWYRPVSDEVELSDIEKANIHFIKSLEQSAG